MKAPIGLAQTQRLSNFLADCAKYDIQIHTGKLITSCVNNAGINGFLLQNTVSVIPACSQIGYKVQHLKKKKTRMALRENNPMAHRAK